MRSPCWRRGARAERERERKKKIAEQYRKKKKQLTSYLASFCTCPASPTETTHLTRRSRRRRKQAGGKSRRPRTKWKRLALLYRRIEIMSSGRKERVERSMESRNGFAYRVGMAQSSAGRS